MWKLLKVFENNIRCTKTVIEMFCVWKENLVRQERDLLDSFCKQVTKLWKVTEFQEPTRVQTLRLFLD